MSEEPKNLLKADLILNYYKDDITERYIRNLTNNIVMDNDILYVTNEKVYITTLEKHCELQQRIDKALKHTHEMLGFLENCVGGNEQEIQHCIKIFNKYLEILRGEDNE